MTDEGQAQNSLHANNSNCVCLMAEAIRTTVVPITPLIGTTVVRIRILMGTTGI